MHPNPTDPKTQTLRYCKVGVWRDEHCRSVNRWSVWACDTEGLSTPAPSPPGRERLFVNPPPGFFPPFGPHKPFFAPFLPWLPPWRRAF